jgi:hypothetical protein
MKLRMQDDSVRFRLTQSEVAKLAGGQRIEAAVRFAEGPTEALIYAVQVGPKLKDVEARFSQREIRVTLPEIVVRTWATTDQVSIENLQPIGNNSYLRILVEKDFRCLHSGAEFSESDNESDAFPNPAEVAS